MDSLDAQSLIVGTINEEMPAPDLWRHHRSGELSCAYSGGTQTFTWDAEAVADMARQWRESPSNQVPDQARPFVSTHLRLEEMFAEQGRKPADMIVHDFTRREIEVRWAQEKVVVIIDEIPETVRAPQENTPPERGRSRPTGRPASYPKL